MQSIAEKIIRQLLSSTGSTWCLRTEVETALKKYQVSVEELLERKVLCAIDEYVTITSIARQEHEIAQDLCHLLFNSVIASYPENELDAVIKEAEEYFGQTFHEQQREAIKMACNNSIFVLTGGPGTGKTTVLKAICFALRKLVSKDMRICFTAPTGKASRRIAESTGEKARTTHKQLEVKPNKVKASMFYNDVLFIDESSMLDNELMSMLCKAIPEGKRVIFVGDIDQLPSVGIGAILRDLIESHVIPTTMLTKTFRQANESGLFDAITKIKNGDSNLSERDDFHPVEMAEALSENDMYSSILKEYLRYVDKYGKENVAVLTPYRKSGICSNKLNVFIQKAVNKIKQGYKYTRKAENYQFYFKQGDFVMQLDNREECANGEVGVITDVGAFGVHVKYIDADVTYSPTELNQIVLAYAMTVHKSQGSEYAAVVTVLFNEHKAMLYKNILYTAVTRAKKECTLFYHKNALITALGQKADANRKTFLAEKLRWVYEQYRLVA